MIRHTPSLRKRVFILGLLLLNFTLLSCGQKSTPLISKELPQVILPSMAGDPVNLQDYKDKTMLLAFWASWCTPCLQEIPMFNKLKDMAPEHFVLVSINVDESEVQRKELPSLVKRYEIGYPVLLASTDIAGKFGGFRGLPTVFLVHNNTIVWQKTGLAQEAELKSEIEKYLGVD